MKKLVLAVLAGALCVPAFADEVQNAAVPAPRGGAQPVAQEQMGQRPGEFKQIREKHEAQMKATQEKVNNLVAEYKKLKSGKKKEAKKAEITALVTSIREEQIKFNEKQLLGFEKRLNQMKESLSAQKEAGAKKAWIDAHTDKLIEENGDLRVLFDRPQGMMAPSMEKPHQAGPRDHRPGPGMKRDKGPRPEFKDVPPQEVPAP